MVLVLGFLVLGVGFETWLFWFYVVCLLMLGCDFFAGWAGVGVGLLVGIWFCVGMFELLQGGIFVGFG